MTAKKCFFQKRKKKKRKQDEDYPTLEQAKLRDDWPEFEKAIEEETKQLEVDEKVFDFIEYKEIPGDVKIIPTMWVFQVKRNSDGSISKYKARLVALG